jgi:HK97 family phage portal protein
MAVIISLGELQSLTPSWQPGTTRSSVHFYDRFNYDYATLYRTQPNVRTCVDFLARNIAQLGLHVFRRISDTDRERLTEHGLAKLLGMPLPASMKVTRYRLIEALISDLGIYFNAYWLKIRQDGAPRGLLRIPPVYMSVQGGLVPTGYEMTIAGRRWQFTPEDVVHFRGYSPENPISGLSPLETLRRVLAEEHAAGQYREEFWQNSARMGGIVKRPAEAPDWSDAARERFLLEFTQLYAGQGSGGKVAALEDGMEWQQITYSAQESEYLAGRRLTREECARAYHIPLPMVGILDHATFSNIKEQHKNLYQDSLGPWLSMLEQDIELQLLADFPDSAGVYVEFNIAEKLQGSFEEQAQSLQSAVGRPWMTANEARARQNLPRDPDPASDRLVTPLNVLVGGQASPRDSAPKAKALPAKSVTGELRERHEQKWTDALTRHYRRQEAAIVSRVPKGRKTDIGGVWWDEERWDSELAADLFRLNSLTAMAWSGLIAAQTGVPASEERMQAWLLEHSQVQASYINAQTRDHLEEALRQPEPLDAVKNVFNLALTVWAMQQAVSAVTSASNFGATEAANAGGLTKKTWRVNSSNPRPSHAALNGVSVGIREKFSNGLRWPGDPAGTAEDNAMCRCTVDFE